MNLIYLDNAATTFPKPRPVYDEVDRVMRRLSGNPGRGSHPLALAASKVIFEARETISDYLGLDSPEHIVFTLNTTYAINLLLKGVLKEGDHVIISDMEHNAVLRPLEKMRREGKITYDIFSTMLSPNDLPRRTPARLTARIAALIKSNTRAVICSHQSNLVSASLPLREIGELCHRHNLLFFVDAAQSAGHLPINLPSMHIDALCAPGHKGLYGIAGCGFIAFGRNLRPDTLIEGGSGYQSLDLTMPDDLPAREEAGTLATPAIASLATGIRYLREHADTDRVAQHERALFDALSERLSSLGQKYRIYLPSYPGPTLLFNRIGTPADRLGAYLADEGFCLRAGYHCAALGHKTLGTPDGGAVRAGFGIFNTLREVDALYSTLRRAENLHEF